MSVVISSGPDPDARVSLDPLVRDTCPAAAGGFLEDPGPHGFSALAGDHGLDTAGQPDRPLLRGAHTLAERAAASLRGRGRRAVRRPVLSGGQPVVTACDVVRRAVLR